MPYLKNELKNVIINGLLFALLGGILAGSLDFLFNYINAPISVGLVLLSLLIGYRIKKTYNSYHILYPTLTILFMIVGLFVAYFTMNIFLHGIGNFFNILGDGYFYLSFIESPISLFILGIKQGNGWNITFGVVNAIIYVVAFYVCYNIAKSSN